MLIKLIRRESSLYYANTCIKEQPILIRTNEQNGFRMNVFLTLVFNDARHFVEIVFCRKVQVGKDQEKAQSEKDSHSKNRGGKKPN